MASIISVSLLCLLCWVFFSQSYKPKTHGEISGNTSSPEAYNSGNTFRPKKDFGPVVKAEKNKHGICKAETNFTFISSVETFLTAISSPMAQPDALFSPEGGDPGVITSLNTLSSAFSNHHLKPRVISSPETDPDAIFTQGADRKLISLPSLKVLLELLEGPLVGWDLIIFLDPLLGIYCSIMFGYRDLEDLLISSKLSPETKRLQCYTIGGGVGLFRCTV